jgi:hypothetical protein
VKDVCGCDQCYGCDTGEPDPRPPVVIEYTDMTDEQKRIVDAGNEPIAGTFPTGLTRDEMLAWITQRFSA